MLPDIEKLAYSYQYQNPHMRNFIWIIQYISYYPDLDTDAIKYYGCINLSDSKSAFHKLKTIRKIFIKQLSNSNTIVTKTRTVNKLIYEFGDDDTGPALALVMKLFPIFGDTDNETDMADFIKIMENDE